MIIDDVRDALDGMDRSDQISEGLIADMRENGLVAVYCPDNRSAKVCGAVNDHFRIARGHVIESTGIRPSEADDDYGFLRAIRNADLNEYGMIPLSFETNTKHETFSVMSGDDLFCLGVTFKLPRDAGPGGWGEEP